MKIKSINNNGTLLTIENINRTYLIKAESIIWVESCKQVLKNK